MDFPEKIKRLPAENHDFLSYALKAEGCDVFFSVIDAGTFIVEHSHGVDALNFVAEGSVTVRMGDAEKTYRLGDWFEIPRGARDTLRVGTKSRLIELWFKH